jgi:hypothetical protein
VSRPKVEPRTFRIQNMHASHLTVLFGVRPNDRILFAHCEDHLNAHCVTAALSPRCPSQRLPSAVDVLHSVPQCPIFTTCTLYTHFVPYFCFVVSCSYRHRTKGETVSSRVIATYILTCQLCKTWCMFVQT